MITSDCRPNCTIKGFASQFDVSFHVLSKLYYMWAIKFYLVFQREKVLLGKTMYTCRESYHEKCFSFLFSVLFNTATHRFPITHWHKAELNTFMESLLVSSINNPYTILELSSWTTFQFVIPWIVSMWIPVHLSFLSISPSPFCLHWVGSPVNVWEVLL